MALQRCYKFVLNLIFYDAWEIFLLAAHVSELPSPCSQNANFLKKQGFSTLLHFVFNCDTRGSQHPAYSTAEIAVFLEGFFINTP